MGPRWSRGTVTTEALSNVLPTARTSGSKASGSIDPGCEARNLGRCGVLDRVQPLRATSIGNDLATALATSAQYGYTVNGCGVIRKRMQLEVLKLDPVAPTCGVEDGELGRSLRSAVVSPNQPERRVVRAQAQEEAHMAVKPTRQDGNRVLDKRLLQRSVASLHARLGIKHDPKMTGEEAQAIALMSGVRPEDRVLSAEILRMRQDEKE
jgi:hypothetical protein